MEIALQWNYEITDSAQKDVISEDMKNEIEQSFRIMDIEAKTVIASISLDPFSKSLVGIVADGPDIFCTFTYSLSSGHLATYRKVVIPPFLVVFRSRA